MATTQERSEDKEKVYYEMICKVVPKVPLRNEKYKYRKYRFSIPSDFSFEDINSLRSLVTEAGEEEHEDEYWSLLLENMGEDKQIFEELKNKNSSLLSSFEASNQPLAYKHSLQTFRAFPRLTLCMFPLVTRTYVVTKKDGVVAMECVDTRFLLWSLLVSGIVGGLRAIVCYCILSKASFKEAKTKKKEAMVREDSSKDSALAKKKIVRKKMLEWGIFNIIIVLFHTLSHFSKEKWQRLGLGLLTSMVVLFCHQLMRFLVNLLIKKYVEKPSDQTEQKLLFISRELLIWLSSILLYCLIVDPLLARPWDLSCSIVHHMFVIPIYYIYCLLKEIIEEKDKNA